MKAWVLNDIKDIALIERDIPSPAPSEVLIKVMAAGICGSDIPRIYENGAHRMPLIPGHEFSGVVAKCGSEADPELINKRVGIFPLIPCKKCVPCRNGHPEMCRDYDYVGSRRDGAFAEYVTVPASNLIELPDAVGFGEAAMLEPMAVAVHAMRMIMDEGEEGPDTEQNIVICGLGPIGLMLLMFLNESGYRNIYVTGNRDSQKKRAAAFGISEERFCDSRENDVPEWIMKKTGGADVYFECVGKNECVINGIASAAPGGKVLLVGNPYSDMKLSKDIYWKILRNQLTVKGTWNSTFLGTEDPQREDDDWHYVIKRLEEKRIDPKVLITHEFAIDDLEKGFLMMRDKTSEHCKVLMKL
ncbi:MAG: galactitol-1-phosphate 5-dehydrogenase [Lachnospiraceae bacterium]|nr:galactitol-1-phosphate 5-dehydrogenase [Lachnospiraceae bacterium]